MIALPFAILFARKRLAVLLQEITTIPIPNIWDRTEFSSKMGQTKPDGNPTSTTTSAMLLISSSRTHPRRRHASRRPGVWRTVAARIVGASGCRRKKKGVQCQPWIPKPESCDWITLFRGSIQLFQSCFNHFERITNLCTKRCWSRLDNTKSKHFTNDPASTSFVPSPNASPSPICIMANVTAKLWYYHVLCPWSRNWFAKLWLSKPIMSNLNDGIFGFPCCLWIHPFVPNWLTCWT